MIGFAHRGAPVTGLQNSLAAFEYALAAGVGGLESDVWVSADGVPMLAHDRRVGGAAIPATRRADLPDAVPSLADLFQRCGRDFALSLDVCDPDPRTADRIIEVVARHGSPDRLYLCGSAQRARVWLARDERVHPVASVPRDLHGRSFDAHVRRLADLGVHVVNQRGTRWTRRRVEAVHAAGMLAFGWGAQARWQLRRLRRIGLDGVYSDHLDRLLAVTDTRPRDPSRAA